MKVKCHKDDVKRAAQLQHELESINLGQPLKDQNQTKKSWQKYSLSSIKSVTFKN